ncbi:MAG: hypothetical protein AMXMBFR4_31470 [Candidatus Hydrogenedentota bacterium]
MAATTDMQVDLTINGVTFPTAALAEICRRYGVERLSLFGSILGDGFSEASDVDILVEYKPDTRIGLIGMANMEADLSEAIGRRVDLRTPGDLSHYFREKVISNARVLHAA